MNESTSPQKSDSSNTDGGNGEVAASSATKNALTEAGSSEVSTRTAKWYHYVAGFVVIVVLGYASSQSSKAQRIRKVIEGNRPAAFQPQRQTSGQSRLPQTVPVTAGGNALRVANTPPPGMLEATQRAWASMQAIDAEADNADFGDYPSKGARQIAYAYSQLPLANVDPAFVQHIRRNIDGLKKLAATLDRIEAKRDELDAQEGRAADIGAALGAAAAASDGASPQQAAGIRDFLGLMAAASTSGARSQFENECAPILQQLQAEADALDQAEAALAEHLSQKYGVPFIDPL